jgi:hypothetical protein
VVAETALSDVRVLVVPPGTTRSESKGDRDFPQFPKTLPHTPKNDVNPDLQHSLSDFVELKRSITEVLSCRAEQFVRQLRAAFVHRTGQYESAHHTTQQRYGLLPGLGFLSFQMRDKYFEIRFDTIGKGHLNFFAVASGVGW